MSSPEYDVELLISEADIGGPRQCTRARDSPATTPLPSHWSQSGLLKGSFIFMADLVRRLDLLVEVDFMTVSSYGSGTTSSRDVRILKDLRGSVEGRDVLVIEDLVRYRPHPESGAPHPIRPATKEPSKPAACSTRRHAVRSRCLSDGLGSISQTSSSLGTASTTRRGAGICPISVRSPCANGSRSASKTSVVASES